MRIINVNLDTEEEIGSIIVHTRYGHNVQINLTPQEVNDCITAIQSLGIVPNKLAQIKTELTLDGN